MYYRPSSSLSFVLDSFQSYLESLSIHQYTNFILLGDFFCNPATPLFSRMKSLYHSFSLTQIVKEPTHVHHDGSTSLIDLVFVSNPVLSNSCHVVPPLSNADHNGIYVQTSWRPTAKPGFHTKGGGGPGIPPPPPASIPPPPRNLENLCSVFVHM